MGDSSEQHRAAPRFPYVAALLCAACVAAAGWTWMRYSYAWHFIPSELLRAIDHSDRDPYEDPGFSRAAGGPGQTAWPRGAFVSLYGVAVWTPELEESYPWEEWADHFPGRKLLVHEPDTPLPFLWVHSGNQEPAAVDARDGVCGRVSCGPGPVTIDMTSNRLTGPSIAGLVVGAMGVFVLAAALRHWLERRRMLE